MALSTDVIRDGRAISDSRISGTLGACAGDKADKVTRRTTKKTRWTHSAAFKAKVATTALKDGRTLAGLVPPVDVHPNPITE